MRISDWSSDVCSSDLPRLRPGQQAGDAVDRGHGADDRPAGRGERRLAGGVAARADRRAAQRAGAAQTQVHDRTVDGRLRALLSATAGLVRDLRIHTAEEGESKGKTRPRAAARGQAATRPRYDK